MVFTRIQVQEIIILIMDRIFIITGLFSYSEDGFTPETYLNFADTGLFDEEINHQTISDFQRCLCKRYFFPRDR